MTLKGFQKIKCLECGEEIIYSEFNGEDWIGTSSIADFQFHHKRTCNALAKNNFLHQYAIEEDRPEECFECQLPFSECNCNYVRCEISFTYEDGQPIPYGDTRFWPKTYSHDKKIGEPYLVDFEYSRPNQFTRKARGEKI